MKRIPLKRKDGTVRWSLVDDEDFEKFGHLKWYSTGCGDHAYAERYKYIGGGKRERQRLHNLILPPSNGLLVDHINGNGLDNRRKNLRLCTFAQNTCNRKIPTHNSSGYIGVSYYKASKKWMAKIGKDGKRFHLGYFDDPKEAALVYRKKAKELFGEYVRKQRRRN